MKYTHRILGTTVAALVMTGGTAALASSHREAPGIATDPAADNTDLWAWTKKGTHDRLYVVAAFNPLEEPSGGPNFHTFSDEVLYEIHITGTGASVADKWIYQFTFKSDPFPFVEVSDMNKSPGGGKEFFHQISLGGAWNQKMTVKKVDLTKNPVSTSVIASNVPVAPPNAGPKTMAVLNTLNIQVAGVPTPTVYNDAYAAAFLKPTNEVAAGVTGSVWAGPRDDGFYVDLGGVFDLANLRAKGAAQDGVAGFNCHAIAIEIPGTLLTSDGMAPGNTPGNRSTVGVWASASRRQLTVRFRSGQDVGIGPWVQVSRLGLPLINEAVIGLQDKDRFNRSRPTTDVGMFGNYILNPIVVRDAEAVGFYKPGGPLASIDPNTVKSGRTDILDVIGLKNIPTANAHPNVTGIGDVLRVDLAVDSSFPNGRPLGAADSGLAPNKENDVTDIILSLALTKLAAPVSDGVDYNDANYLSQMPFLPLPWPGFDKGHGKPTP
jgi:hypothetical protein